MPYRKQEEANLKNLESCHYRREQAIKASKSCDCTLSAYADIKMKYAQQVLHYNKYAPCFYYGKFVTVIQIEFIM